MEKHYKKIKEKQNKIKLVQKKSISIKNSSFGTKQSNKCISNNKKFVVDSSKINSKNIILNNLLKHNATITKYNTYIANAIIFDQRNHIVAVFKNYLLWDETSEFLKRYYTKKETFTRLPKICEYYEQFTLFIPNYFGNEGLIVIIMIKFIKRKRKYLKYLEEKEEDEEKKKNKNKNNNINKNFEPLIKKEILGKTKSKSLFSSCLDISKNTLELTNYENDFSYLKMLEEKRKTTNKIIKEKNLNKIDNLNEKICNNSISFTEIIDDLSSHFSILINNNSYKDYIQKSKKIPIKSLTNRMKLSNIEINTKNIYKKLSIQNLKQKSLSLKDTSNKLQNNIKKENNNNNKSKEIHKSNKYKKKISTKKINLLKEEKKGNENHNQNNINNENVKISNNNKKSSKIKLLEINSIKEKNNKSNNIINSKNLKIINNNSSQNNKKKDDEKSNVMNTIANIKSQYYSFGKLIKNKKQRSAIKNINIKSLNLVNMNQNAIPNLKKIFNKKKERRIIFPRNSNYIYNNNTNKLNSIKGENFEHIKLLTDRDKENFTLINNSNENSRLMKLNENTFLNNNQIINQKNKVDAFSQKVGKLIKKKNIYLIGENISYKDTSNKNSFLHKNGNNENIIGGNIKKLNNLHYKKNTVLRQFNSKKDFNFNNKNNIFSNYNNISNSNNSMNSSSSSSLNNLNKKRYKLSNNAISQNSSLNKRKSLQKINLNLNLQINFNINIDKKNKKLILAKRLNNRIINEQINKNDKFKKIKINNNNSNCNVSVPQTQRYYYNINNNCYNVLGKNRSSSSSNSKKKKK